MDFLVMLVSVQLQRVQLVSLVVEEKKLHTFLSTIQECTSLQVSRSFNNGRNFKNKLRDYGF